MKFAEVKGSATGMIGFKNWQLKAYCNGKCVHSYGERHPENATKLATFIVGMIKKGYCATPKSLVKLMKAMKITTVAKLILKMVPGGQGPALAIKMMELSTLVP